MYYTMKGSKGLKKSTTLEMAPLTILVGKNGSGKSSVISALDKIKTISSIGTRFKKNVMESYLSFNVLNRTDFGCEISDDLEYEIPINLSFFKDKFELRTKYSCNRDLMHLSKFEIFNKTRNAALFLIQEEKLNEDLELPKITIRINLAFLIEEFKRLKNTKPFDWKLLKDHIASTSAQEIEETMNFEAQQFQQFKKNLQVGFNDYKDNFKQKNEALEEIKELSHNFESLQSTTEDLSLFVIQKEGETLKAENYIEKLISSIQNGMKINHSSYLPGIDHLVESLFNEKSKHIIFSHESLSKNESITSGYNMPELLNAEITQTLLFRELIDNMLIDNIHSNTSYLLSNSKFTYIPPNRIAKYSNENESSAGFALKRLSEGLKYLGYSDKSSSFFINYWFKQFNISENINNLDLAIKLLEDKKNMESEGYGIQQIIPLIIILSLSDKLHNSDLTNNQDQWMQSFFDQVRFEDVKKFLIEEPEANLHPSFQSKLADLFLDAWIKYDHEFVIETHSEYLIRKLQYHVGTGKIDSNVINIYYFDKNEQPRKININKDGSLSEEFGSGFYDEADNLSIELFKLNKSYLN